MKFDLNLNTDTLSVYLKKKLGWEVNCRKIDSMRSRYSSFCVTAECNDVVEMCDPQLWPAGYYIWRYYEPRPPEMPVGGRQVRRVIPPPSYLRYSLWIVTGNPRNVSAS